MTTLNTKVEDQKHRLEYLKKMKRIEKHAKDAGISRKNLAERVATAGSD